MLPLPEIGHGQHCCQIFSSPEKHAGIVVPFLALGLARGEQTVYVGDPDSVELMRRGLREAGVDVEREEAAGRLALSSERDYLDNGHFNPDKMLSFLQRAYDAALASGASALRAAGNVAWQVGPDRDFKDVVHYEALLDIFFLGKRMVGLCCYPRQDSPPEVLSGILHTHRAAGIDGGFVDNFHYLPAGLLTEPDAGVRESLRADWMSSQLRRACRAEEERDRLRGQLAQTQKLEAIGRLAGGVAHDFNNLLTVILGYNSLLLEEGGASRPSLEKIRDACERAQALTQQLLSIGRRQVLNLESLDLNLALKRSEGLLRDLAGPLVDLSVRTHAGLWRMRGDPAQLDQVLMNLVVNARDAMPTGGQLTVETDNVDLDEAYAGAHPGVTAGPHVMLAVTDTGVGMDRETCARIFDPFFTTKGEGKGTGLGLATVFGVVKNSGGNIWFYSEPGRGSTFKLYFPRAAEGQAARPAGRAPESPARRRPGTVLLVDDQEDLRNLVASVLGGAGHTVLAAAGVEEALRLCREHPGGIDVLLTDLVLSDGDGVELAGLARKLCPDLKLAFMSGYPDEAVRRKGGLLVDSHFITKPFLPTALLREVESLI
jgi:signal transduction histidine kinase